MNRLKRRFILYGVDLEGDALNSEEYAERFKVFKDNFTIGRISEIQTMLSQAELSGRHMP